MMMMIMCVVMMKRDLTPMTFVAVFSRSVRLLLCLRAGWHRTEVNMQFSNSRAAVIGVVVMETHCRCNSGESKSNSNKSGLEVKF